MDINEFPPGVIEHLGWYVYRLIDPRDGSTFYVGKGKGNRVFAHMRGEVAAADDDELLSNKLKQLREIRLAGLEVIHVIHRHGIADEKTAYEVEAALIDAYPGLTNIMNGAGSNEYGAAHIKELIATYQPETVEFKHKALMISVNRSSKDVDLYDAVRFSWRVSLERASKAEVILATVKGIVRGVYIADEWLKSTRDNFLKCANGMKMMSLKLLKVHALVFGDVRHLLKLHSSILVRRSLMTSERKGQCLL